MAERGRRARDRDRRARCWRRRVHRRVGFGAEQRAARGENFERGRAAEGVAGGRDAVRFARGGNELVANEDDLSHRGAGVGVRRAHVLRDLRARVAIRRRRARFSKCWACAMSPRRVLPVEDRKRQRDAGREQRRAGRSVVALRRRTSRSGSQNSLVRLGGRVRARLAGARGSRARAGWRAPIASMVAESGSGGGMSSESVGAIGAPMTRPSVRLSEACAFAMSRSLPIRSFSACATPTCAWMTSSLAAVPASKRACVRLRKSSARVARLAEILAVLAARRAASRRSPTPGARRSAAAADSWTRWRGCRPSPMRLFSRNLSGKGMSSPSADRSRRRAAEGERSGRPDRMPAVSVGSGMAIAVTRRARASRGLLARDLELRVPGERFGDGLPSREVQRVCPWLPGCVNAAFVLARSTGELPVEPARAPRCRSGKRAQLEIGACCP